jgi:flagellar basal body-associated protein FliL
MVNPRSRGLLMLLVLMASMASPFGLTSVASAEPSSIDEALEAEGLYLVALRNDTLDLNQDGDADAIRVVVIMNTTNEFTNIELRLYGVHKDREVHDSQTMSFAEQSNASIVYDAWAQGEHTLRLEIVNQNGETITTIQLPTYVLRPALKTPQITLELEAPAWIETGDACTIDRVFYDQTGPRYAAAGVRTFSGAPFTVLDNQTSLNCSHWPAGEYSLKEAYRNDLGQTTESWLNITIHNRPAPAFSLEVRGDGNTTDSPCLITMVPNMAGVDFSSFNKIWSVQGQELPGSSSDTYDCSVLPAGVHLVSLEVINNEQIRTVHGLNLVRQPGQDLTKEEADSLPSRSFGEDTATESVGWYSIGALGLIVAVLVFFMLVRVKDEEEGQGIRSLGPTPTILPDGSPDPEGMPTTTDGTGTLWRQHADGSMDWWDQDLRIWHKW